MGYCLPWTPPQLHTLVHSGVPIPGLAYRRKSGKIVQLELEDEADADADEEEQQGAEEDGEMLFKMC